MVRGEPLVQGGNEPTCGGAARPRYLSYLRILRAGAAIGFHRSSDTVWDDDPRPRAS